MDMADWVDTHAHLDDPKFDVDRDSVLQRAVQNSVVQIVTVGADLASSRAATALAVQNSRLAATVGIHPHRAQSLTLSGLAELRGLAQCSEVVAIGEIGLDYYRDLSPRASQLWAFQAQLDLAAELGKPVIVHIRDERGVQNAYHDALSTLERWMRSRPVPHQPPGVLHCYSGDLATAQSALEMGFLIGVDGPVTYPNAQALQSLVARLPLERLLLETDCPYLAPQARRGRRNEPAYLPLIGQKVAQLQGISAEQVADVTTRSARALFALPDIVGKE